MYTVVKEMLLDGRPVDNIWISQDDEEDEVFTFREQALAILKAEELQASDTTGREYKVISTEG